jgi:RNA polymerase-binding transcription factor DksA
MTASTAAPRPAAAGHPSVDLAALRRALHDEVAAHQAQLSDLRATIDELTGQTDADSVLERELAEHALERALAAIGECQDALARVEDGTFGACQRCGGSIAPARLEAIPSTRHCVDCPPPTPTLLG